MPTTVGFYVIPAGAGAGARGKRIGELAFPGPAERDRFGRVLSVLTALPVAELFRGEGDGFNARETGQLLTELRTAMGSSTESTLSSAMSAELVSLETGPLEGKLDAFCEILGAARRESGLLTSLVE